MGGNHSPCGATKGNLHRVRAKLTQVDSPLLTSLGVDMRDCDIQSASQTMEQTGLALGTAVPDLSPQWSLVAAMRDGKLGSEALEAEPK
ncbi:hypothetical protein P3T76_013377 [Phytophthora citrophthora]|uniref:Uncharacterized protein n=1 Tax=Phytophthora citrophthora TaxID=4793 RepID=A0AAD9G3E8_9STRA|nr:hypothetical protein P3T76_013377 [Phytophthora citrophthora]